MTTSKGVAFTVSYLLASGCGVQPAAQNGGPAPSAPDPGRTEAEPAPGVADRAATREDPELGAKLADLEAMCAALDRDYVDGTLSDYFAGLRPTTTWGKSLRERGDESMKPGRVLEAAVHELGAPETPACERMLEYLDDVE